MSKYRFPKQRKSKLNLRGDGPFQVLKRVNNNAHRLDLPSEYEVNATFNVSDLILFVGSTNGEANPLGLRSNHFQEGADEGKPLAKGPTPRVMVGRTQEDWVAYELSRSKLMFTWATKVMKA